MNNMNNMNNINIMKINKVLNNFIFIINVIFIILSEFIFYFFNFQSYEKYINNVTNRLAILNILYVKIFQALALTTKYNNNNQNLLKYTDDAPWSEEDIDLDTLHNLETQFNLRIENGYKPINSGMISLVFKGVILDTSEEVVIKMKRNNIENVLNDAIEKLLFCIYLASFIPIINNYQISEVTQNSINLIRHQINFSEEIQNMEKMRNNCKYLRYIIIPRVYPGATDMFSNVILMEYIEGKTVSNVLPEDYSVYATQVIKFALVNLFMKGLCHGDLHVGNILFIKDENAPIYKHKICILDFGLVYEIEKTRDAFFYIFSNMCLLSAEEIAAKTMLSGILDPVSKIIDLKIRKREHYDNIMKILTEFIYETIHISHQLSQQNILKMVTNLNDYLNNNNLIIDNMRIRPSDDLVKFQVIFAMVHGVVLRLCGDTYIEMANKVMTDLFHIDVSES